MKKILVNLGDRSYDVLIGKGIISRLPKLLKGIVGTPKVLLITSQSINRLYGKQIAKLLKGSRFEVTVCLLPEGETAKAERQLFRIYSTALKAGLDRFSGMVALGGGAVGDVAGFAASTYLRGVAFINIPTTLLAQVDSAIGGKTAINLKEAKNLVGTFYQPRLVLSDIDLITSLPKREYLSSIGEIIKYGVIASPSLFRYLENNASGLLKRKPAVLEKVIAESSLIKAKVVEMDERELTGFRAILNYGHTFGHAYEKVAGYGALRHGEAVAVGMCEAARLAEKKMLLKPLDRIRIENLVEKLQLPTTTGKRSLSPRLLREAMMKDKKKKGKEVRYILPIRIGKVIPVAIDPYSLF
jgi:3-dehydroquinate synthase